MDFTQFQRKKKGPVPHLQDPLWERQPGESRQAYQAFCHYRDLGPNRSARKVAEELKKSKQLMDRWMSIWRWVERAEAWDGEQDRVALDARLEGIKDMEKRHTQIASLALNKVLARVAKMHPEELSTADIARFAQIFVDVERKARGEAERFEHKIEGPSVDELAKRLAAGLPDWLRDAVSTELDANHGRDGGGSPPGAAQSSAHDA